MRAFGILAVLLCLTGPSQAQERARSIDNPVLEGVADAGVLKYQGEYYIMGVGTGGDLYTSSDLVHWRGPEHAFSMDNDWTPGPAAQDRRIHANDFEYLNGTFHLYWSVNYWGEPEMTVRIGHATASEVRGPYRESVTTTWFDSRIDPHLFVDDDGTPYFYSVKFADGNVIYGQEMSDPWTLVGRPRFLLSASPGTWETRTQHRIIEGAEVDKYRDRYYMLYAANHVGARWGQYGIGVAEADHPLGFNNATKYDHPVVGPTNEERLEEAAEVILPIGKGTWRYRTEPPDEADWTQVAYDDSDWEEGAAAFGGRVVENSTTYRTHTRWETPDLWLRKTFQLAKQPSEHLQLLMRLHGAADIYVNGERIYRSDGVQNYATIDVEKVDAFRQGKNVLAVRAQRTGDDPYVDVGLLDPETQPGEAYIFSPGQPNLVRGPNGFEWWLVYLGRFDGGGKSQAVDRVYFFDQKLHVDGPTGPRTPGYHPPPRLPTVRDLFGESDRSRLGTSWQRLAGNWRVRGGEAVQRSETGGGRALVAGPVGTHYLFQAGVRLGDEAATEAGVVAFQNETGDQLLVGLDRQAGTWTYRLREGERQVNRSFALPEGFDYSAYHTFRVTKNGGTFHIEIDGRPAQERSTLETGLTGSGRPGLYTRAAGAAFDGVAYTRGWDEHDAHISGWTTSRGEGRAWRTDSTGLHQTSPRGTHRVVKGEPLEAYEFSTQVYGDLQDTVAAEETGYAGFLPVYVDEESWLRAAVDMDRHQLVVEQRRKGGEVERQTVALPEEMYLYPDATYSDDFSKRYTLRSPILVEELRVVSTGTTSTHALPAAWEATYWHDEAWKAFPEGSSSAAALTETLRLEGGEDAGEIGRLRARVGGKSTYNLRAVKRPGAVLLFVDGQQVLRVSGDWPASRVGLTTQDMPARFDGLLRFEVPTQASRQHP